MSIKQNGGVFGRNPTFNDVTIEGQLTFDGDIDINSDLKVDGDLDVTGKASIGTVSSLKTLTVGGTGLRVESTTSADFYSTAQDALIVNNGTSNFRFWNNGAERMRLDSSGHAIIPAGVTLGTATGVYSAAKTLDDYEEGTWTPTITDLTNAVTATSQGTYTKVGRHVICSFRVTASSLGSASGAIYISGLPFTVKNDNGARGTGAIGFTQNLNLGSAGQTVTVFPSNNQVYAALNVWDATVGTSGMQASELSATGALYGSLEYFV